MKNVHILPTNKPSRLVKIYNDVNRETFTLKLDVEVNDSFKEYVNIHITSDEETKKGDWVLNPIYKTVYKWIKNSDIYFDRIDAKKIILTTDQDLIKDGVQEINDGFLEWFVKNLNCNFVRTIKVPYFDESSYSYVLIIPLEEAFELVSIGEETVKLAIPMIQDREEIKQETLEEVRKVERTELFNSIYSVVKKIPRKDVDGDAMDAISCAYEIEQLFYEWQQERMYSEEEVLEIIDSLFHRYASSFRIDAKEYFLQFKKQ